jgi:hypothetical protein
VAIVLTIHSGILIHIFCGGRGRNVLESERFRTTSEVDLEFGEPVDMVPIFSEDPLSIDLLRVGINERRRLIRLRQNSDTVLNSYGVCHDVDSSDPASAQNEKVYIDWSSSNTSKVNFRSGGIQPSKNNQEDDDSDDKRLPVPPRIETCSESDTLGGQCPILVSRIPAVVFDCCYTKHKTFAQTVYAP